MIIENRVQIPPQGGVQNKYIIIHDVGQDGSTIDNEATYMLREWRNNQAFVHYFVSDTRIVQVAQTGTRAWGAGYINKYAPVQIEMSHVPANRIDAQLKLLGELVRMEAKKFGIPLVFNPNNANASGIVTHHWASTHYGGSNHVDPDGYLGSRGKSLTDLANAVTNGSTPSPVTPTKQPEAVKVLPLSVDGVAGVGTIKALQKYLGTPIDGYISGQNEYNKQFAPAFTTIQTGGGGSYMIVALQKFLKINADGYAGADTWKALQKRLGVTADGYAGKDTVIKLQKALNAWKL